MQPQKILNAIREDECVTVQLEADGPMSLMPQKSLDKRTIVDDTDNETTFAVEYRLPGTDRVVHRSAHVQLKKGLPLAGALGEFGG